MFPYNICHYSKRAQTCHLLFERIRCYHSTSKTHVWCRIFKRAWTCHLLCKRLGCYHSTSKTHVRDRIFKRVRTCHLLCKRLGCYSAPARHTWETGSLNWTQFMLQWLIRFPEFIKRSAPFRESPREQYFPLIQMKNFSISGFNLFN